MKKRIISSIVMLAIVIPAMVVTSWAGDPGRIVGLVLYSLVGMLGIYEVLKSFGVSIMTSVVMTTVIPMVIMFPYQESLEPLISFGDYGHNFKFYEVITMMIGSWEPWVIMAIFAFLTIAVETQLWKQWKKCLLIYLFMFIAPLFIKLLWAINVFDFWYVFYFIGISIVSDSFAYFGGMLFGKKMFNGAKFAPNISPKKTWAGFVIGTAFAVIAATIAGYFGGVFSDFKDYELLVSMLVGVALAFISPFGDLLFSYFKRVGGVKDFSNLIPGHGGIFDRVDAMSVVTIIGSLIILFANLLY